MSFRRHTAHTSFRDGLPVSYIFCSPRTPLRFLLFLLRVYGTNLGLRACSLSVSNFVKLSVEYADCLSAHPASREARCLS